MSDTLFENINLSSKRTIQIDRGEVTGVAILPEERLVLTYNSYLKAGVMIIDRGGSTEFERKLTPGFVSGVSYNKDDNEVIVSKNLSNSGKFILMDINSGKEKKQIELNERIGGLDVQDRFVLYCTDDGVKMCGLEYDYKETVLESCVKCGFESHVATTAKHIYISNHGNSTVMCCDFQGALQWTYCDEEILVSPRGLTVDSFGNVYVAGQTSNNVVIISNDGKQYREILSEKNGLCKPSAIHFDKHQSKLLVANLHGRLHIFTLEMLNKSSIS